MENLLTSNDQDLLKILKHYGKTESSLKEDIENIGKWMKTQPHFPEILDSNYIINFLILCKFEINKAKINIDNYYCMRNEFPDFFKKIHPRYFKEAKVSEIISWAVLPKKTPEMSTVHFLQINNIKLAEDLDVYLFTGLGLAILETILSQDVMASNIFILDAKMLSMTFLSKWTPTLVMTICKVYMRIFSMRLQGLYMINSPSYINTFVTMVKSFLKPKIAQRIQAFKDEGPLKQQFPHDILPKDYGGTELSVSELSEKMHLKMWESCERFDKLEKMKVDESMRPENLKQGEQFGAFGNFKKIEID